MQSTILIEPQPKQAMALASPADILIFGGAAGGGKSWTLLLESIRHYNNALWNFVIFRRTSPMITNPGGLWSESQNLYTHLRAVPNLSDLTWKFPSGMLGKFAHLQHDKDVHNWQGAQIGMLGLDELPHFTEYQFWYLFSRLRSVSGIKPYIRCTCNPDVDSWVAGLIAWWIDQDQVLPDGKDNPNYGYPLMERAGVLRWFVRLGGNQLFWADTKEELAEQFPELVVELGDGFAKSLTFIPSRVQDNQKLLGVDPGYLGNLYALPLVDRERLLGGNWKVKAEAGKVFNRSWFKVVDRYAMPQKLDIVCTYWDLAATEKELKGDDPDFSARVVIGYTRHDAQWWILDASQSQSSPAEVELLVDQSRKTDEALAKSFGARYILRWEQEPGSAGKREAYRLVTKFRGTDAAARKETRGKIERAKPLSRQAEAGNVHLMAGSWNNEYLSHMHGQPDLPHDDLMDGSSGAFNEILAEHDFAGSF